MKASRFLPAHNVAEWLETPITRLDSSSWDTAEWGAQAEAALSKRALLPDWAWDPGHRLQIMGEIAAPKKTTTPSSRPRAPFCSKQQRISSRIAALYRAAKLAIGGFQRAQLPAEVWPFFPANLRSIMDHRGAAFPPPRHLDPRTCRRKFVAWLRSGASPSEPDWQLANLDDLSAAGIARTRLRLKAVIN